jgi:23S rRNA (adenine2503-C2)-methyltransferase
MTQDTGATWADVAIHDDPSGNVAKYVFTGDKVVAEAVLYRYPTYAERTVICCSTQSGCPVGCRFCGAGDAFIRSLSPEEIVDQPRRLLADVFEQTGTKPEDMGRLQIMFMSMGEPLLNLKHLTTAMRELYAAYPGAALLISTSAPRIDYEPVRTISQAIPTIGLQFSVHESTDENRDALIPFKNKLNLREIAAEGRAWAEATGRRPFFNYCAGPHNSGVEDADRIAALFDPGVFNATVSVICERNEGLPATSDYQRSLATGFARLLVERGFDTRMFDPAGQDTIGGGCGQLWRVQEFLRSNPDVAKPSIGRGLPEVHAPAAA